jgi:hypothetical protein
LSHFLSSIFALVVLLVNQSGSVDTRLQASANPNTKSVESTVSCTDSSYAKELPPPGPACEKELFARRGRPFMFPAHDGIAFGVSSGPDKPVALHLWADNQTDKAESLYFCCVSTLFEHIDIFDSEGHRVLSKGDQAEQKARSEGLKTVEVCSCSGWLSVPPHTIQLLDAEDISRGYTLQPGRYTVLERNTPALDNLRPNEHEAAHHNSAGLTISVP